MARFEAMFDAKNTAHSGAAATAEADAVEGIRYLARLRPRPLFMANHPSRQALDSPHEFRNWADAGPEVVRGFEAAPGHQGAVLSGSVRGEYDHGPDAGSSIADLCFTLAHEPSSGAIEMRTARSAGSV